MTAPNNTMEEQMNGSRSSHPALAKTPATETAPPPKKRSKSAKSTATKTSASKKISTKTRPTKAAPKERLKRTKANEPSDADIRLRAYFIAERRVQRALQGDPANDWLEAKRQLLEEAAVPVQF